MIANGKALMAGQILPPFSSAIRVSLFTRAIPKWIPRSIRFWRRRASASRPVRKWSSRAPVDRSRASSRSERGPAHVNPANGADACGWRPTSTGPLRTSRTTSDAAAPRHPRLPVVGGRRQRADAVPRSVSRPTVSLSRSAQTDTLDRTGYRARGRAGGRAGMEAGKDKVSAANREPHS